MAYDPTKLRELIERDMKQFTTEELRSLAAKSERVVAKGNPQSKKASSSASTVISSDRPAKPCEAVKTPEPAKATERKRPPSDSSIDHPPQKMATDCLLARRQGEPPTLPSNFGDVHPISLWEPSYPHQDLVDKYMSTGQDVAMCAAAGPEFLAHTLYATGNQITFFGRQLEIQWRAHQKSCIELKSLKEKVAQQAEAVKNFHALQLELTNLRTIFKNLEEERDRAAAKRDQAKLDFSKATSALEVKQKRIEDLEAATLDAEKEKADLKA